MSDIRRSCGTVEVRSQDGSDSRRWSGTGDGTGSTGGGGQPPARTPSELPVIGTVSRDNPRAIAAGALAGGILLSRVL